MQVTVKNAATGLAIATWSAASPSLVTTGNAWDRSTTLLMEVTGYPNLIDFRNVWVAVQAADGNAYGGGTVYGGIYGRWLNANETLARWTLTPTAATQAAAGFVKLYLNYGPNGSIVQVQLGALTEAAPAALPQLAVSINGAALLGSSGTLHRCDALAIVVTGDSAPATSKLSLSWVGSTLIWDGPQTATTLTSDGLQASYVVPSASADAPTGTVVTITYTGAANTGITLTIADSSQGTTGDNTGGPSTAPQCFAPCVRVRMADGSLKAVGEIAVGDHVRIVRQGCSAEAEAAVVHVRRNTAAANERGAACFAQMYAFQPAAACDILITGRHRVVYDGVLACAEAHEAVQHAPREAIPLVHIAVDAPRAWLMLEADGLLAEPLL